MSTIATVSGVMLAPGVSKNGRLYTPRTIARAVERMSARIADPDQPPIVMRSHHAAGDDSTRIVGKLVEATVDPSGKANYRAELHDTAAARDILDLVEGDKPALRNVSIYGWWLGDEKEVDHQGGKALTAEDLEIVAVDFTASPGVVQAQVTSVKAEAVELPPVHGKADLRRALKTAETVPDPALRRYVMERAERIGLAAMVPTNWAPDGTTREISQEGRVIVTESVDEAYVQVTVGDEKTDVNICIYQVDPSDVAKVAKNAAKTAASMLMPTGDGGMDYSAESVRLTIDGQPVDEHTLYQTIAAAGAKQLAERRAAAAVEAAPTPAGVPGQNTTPPVLPEETAVTTSAPAAETAAPTITLDAAGLKALVGEAVNAALDARKAAKGAKPAATVETVEAPAKAGKGKKTTEKAPEAAPASETHGEVTAESVTKADLADLVKDLKESMATELEESRNKLREEIVSSGGVQRRGYRTTEASAENLPPMEELWANRADILLGDLGKVPASAA